MYKVRLHACYFVYRMLLVALLEEAFSLKDELTFNFHVPNAFPLSLDESGWRSSRQTSFIEGGRQSETPRQS